MPRSPRRRRLPPAPKFPSIPRVQLSPLRSEGSVELDHQLGSQARLVPFVRWDEFLRVIRFEQGQHVTIVGTTGSGKTVLGRELLKHRDFVVVLGTKPRDPELYEPFQREGYELVSKFDAQPDLDESRIIFRPTVSTPDDAGLQRQRQRFQEMLFDIYESGGWTIYADEIFIMTNRLKLATVFETLWTQGRSLNITLVVATQLPVKIPLLAFDQATHLFLFRNSDRVRIQRMAEFAGADVDLVRKVIPLLPQHEFLYCDTRTGTLLRSKVILHRR